MNPLIQTAIKVGSRVSPKFLQGLDSQRTIMKMIERAKAIGGNPNTIKQLEKAWKILSRRMGEMK